MNKKFEEARKIQRLWEEAKNTSDLNFIELLHCNENAHSRILAELLKYQNGEFRKSFLEIAGISPKKEDISNAEICLEYPANIDNKAGRIDILIYKKGKFAIIIENKGNGAGEQEDQISRYVKYLVDTEKYSKDNIYCLYLTQDGGTPSEYSLHETEKKILSEHLKPINYKYDILNWLKEDVLPNIQYRDKNLIEGVSHYIHFLERKYYPQNVPVEVSQHFANENTDDLFMKLFEASSLLNEEVSIFQNIDHVFQMGDLYLFDKKDHSHCILIYKDKNKYSLGWAPNGKDKEDEQKEKTPNKYGCPHRLCEAKDLLEELKQKGITIQPDNESCIEDLISLNIYKQTLEIFVSEKFKNYGYNLSILNNDGYNFCLCQDNNRCILIYKDKDNRYSLGWTKDLNVKLDSNGENKYKCPCRFYDDMNSLIKGLMSIIEKQN